MNLSFPQKYIQTVYFETNISQNFMKNANAHFIKITNFVTSKPILTKLNQNCKTLSLNRLVPKIYFLLLRDMSSAELIMYLVLYEVRSYL